MRYNKTRDRSCHRFLPGTRKRRFCVKDTNNAQALRHVGVVYKMRQPTETRGAERQFVTDTFQRTDNTLLDLSLAPVQFVLHPSDCTDSSGILCGM